MIEMRQIKVDGFDGPLDLLLDLIERQKLDITGIALTQVTDQYWQHVKSRRETEPEALGEFIVIGSKLLYLKSCAVIPSASPPSTDVSGDAEEVAVDLTGMLKEYKRFKDAASLFRQLEEQGHHTYARPNPGKTPSLSPGLQGVTLDTLLDAVKEALARKPVEPEGGLLHIEPITVDVKVQEIGAALTRQRGRLQLRSLLADCQTRTEVVVVFLAVLELIKTGGIWAEQDRPFGEITLVSEGNETA